MMEQISEPFLLKAYLWRMADRVSLETVMPPVFGKEVGIGSCSHCEAPP